MRHLADRRLPHRDVRFDPLVLHDSVQNRGSAVRRVADQALGREIELLFNALEHSPGRFDFFGAVTRCGLHIERQ